MGSPHQICNSLQAQRSSGIGTRTYAQERGYLQSDLEAANVPKSKIDALLARTDAYFADHYARLGKQLSPAGLKQIFGDWTP